MTKLVSVTTRLDTKSLTYIQKISKMTNQDRSAAFREILEKGIHEDKKEKALDNYMKGKFSIGKAARFAEMHIGEFYELMNERGIENNLTLQDFEESLRTTRQLFK